MQSSRLILPNYFYTAQNKFFCFFQVFSTKELDNILRGHSVFFGKNLDVTSFSDDKRETHNPEGRAHAPVVWDYYNNGCSVR